MLLVLFSTPFFLLDRSTHNEGTQASQYERYYQCRNEEMFYCTSGVVYNADFIAHFLGENCKTPSLLGRGSFPESSDTCTVTVLLLLVLQIGSSTMIRMSRLEGD